MTDLLDFTIRDLIAGYRAKTLSPHEYWLAVEARIEAFEPHVAALYAYDPQGAREQARASTERWLRDEPLGPLDGIPVSLKELIATKGQPVPLGTPLSSFSPPRQTPRLPRA